MEFTVGLIEANYARANNREDLPAMSPGAVSTHAGFHQIEYKPRLHFFSRNNREYIRSQVRSTLLKHVFAFL